VTYKVLTLIWRHSQGDKSIDLEELRSNKSLQEISLDQAADAEDSDPEDSAGVAGDDMVDEDIVLPPTAPPGEKPPGYDKGPILSAVLPLSMAKFWHFFLSDESSHYKDAHIAKGDKDPTLSAWEVVEGRYQRVLDVKADVKSKLVKGLFPVHGTHKCYLTDSKQMV